MTTQRIRCTSFCLALCLALPAALAAAPGESGDRRVERQVIRLHGGDHGSDGPDGPDGERVHERRVVVLAGEDGGRPVTLERVLTGGYLGVELVRLTPELRTHFGAPAEAGVMVARVEPDSPAAAAGLSVGDLLTAIDGEAVSSPWDLSMAVRRHEEGERVRLEVVRGGRTLALDATVGKRDRTAVDLAPLLEWQDAGEGARVFKFRGEPGEGGAMPHVVFQGKAVERLGESLEKVDWRALGGSRRDLVERIDQLEERLRELERELEGARRR